MTYRFLLFFVCFLTIFSCKNEPKVKLEEEKLNRIPNFGNVELKKVFTKAETKLEDEATKKEFIDHYYKTIWEAGDLWGGFLVAKGDDIIYEKYRGYSEDVGRNSINRNTPLHVASISKSITAMAVMKLVEAGKLSLKDDVRKFFPKLPYPNVTVQSLLTQRSGLPKYEYFIEKIKPEPVELSKKFLTNQDVLNMLIRYKPPVGRAPETGFAYCNTNYALLALIVEKITETTFPKAMNEIVFEPLKMKDTYIFQEKDTLTAAKSFYNRGPKIHPYDRLDLIYGDKNLYTTPRDLLNFSVAMYAPNFLRKDLMDMVFRPYSNERPGINNYGIGFRMKVFDNGEKLTYHTGWWHGTNSVFAHLLKSKVTIIAIGNKFSRGPYSALTLSALFENFPYETEKLEKVMGEENETDSATTENSAADTLSVSD